MEKVEELTKDKVRLVEEYEAKLAKSQECYERELEAMRRTHQLTTENLLAWKRTEVNQQCKNIWFLLAFLKYNLVTVKLLYMKKHTHTSSNTNASLVGLIDSEFPVGTLFAHFIEIVVKISGI